MLDDLKALPREHKLAAGASLILALSLFLPWYYDRKKSESLSGLHVFTWVEAAVLLVALGVLVLVYARARRKAFHLPGGDGTIVVIAGVWAAILVFYRMVVDRPGGVEELGIEWGIFASLLAAGALAWTGLQIRAAHRPEPPLPKAAAEPEPTAPLEPTTRVDPHEQLTLDDPPPRR
jgi:hypothetical protein